jgi:hypothetical protein
MTSPTWAASDVHELLALVLANLRMGGAVEATAIPLDEVAATCGFSASSLLKDCYADRIEHVQYGRGRAMTPTQIAKFLAQHSRGGDLVAERTASPEPDDELAKARAELADARAESRRNADRQRPRKAS